MLQNKKKIESYNRLIFMLKKLGMNISKSKILSEKEKEDLIYAIKDIIEYCREKRKIYEF